MFAPSVSDTTHSPVDPALAVDRQMFRLWFGPDAPLYERLLDRMLEQHKGLRRPVASWSWAAFAGVFPWLFYHRQWSAGIGFVAILVLAGIMGIANPGGTIGACVAFGLFGRSVMVREAQRQIGKTSRDEGARERLRERLARNGGVSRWGAVVGGTALIAFVGLAHLA